MAHIRPWESPYVYTGNNPLNNIDPTGEGWFYYQAAGDETATYHWHDGDEITTVDQDGNISTLSAVSGGNTFVQESGSWFFLSPEGKKLSASPGFMNVGFWVDYGNGYAGFYLTSADAIMGLKTAAVASIGKILAAWASAEGAAQATKATSVMSSRGTPAIGATKVAQETAAQTVRLLDKISAGKAEEVAQTLAAIAKSPGGQKIISDINKIASSGQHIATNHVTQSALRNLQQITQTFLTTMK